MRAITTLTLMLALSTIAQGQECQLKVIGPRDSGGVYSPHGPIGVIPFNGKVDIERSGRLFIVSRSGQFVELDASTATSTNCEITPTPFELRIDPSSIPSVEFCNLEPQPGLAQTSIMINGIPAGGFPELADLSNALRDYVSRTFPKKNEKSTDLRLTAMIVKSMAPHTRKPLAFNNYSIIHHIEWQLVDKRTSKVLVEKQVHGGHYIGDLKLTGGKDRVREIREEESYANRMAAISTLQSFLSDPEVIAAMSGSRPPTADMEGEPIKVSGTVYATTLQQAAGSVVTVKSTKGFGSAFFISEDGYLLTNDHVIPAHDSMLTVVLNNGFTTSAQVVRRSPLADVALLKLSGARMVPLQCDPSIRKVGDEVYAIGTPEHQDLSQTLTKGIISGLRTVDGRSYIQTDVSINRGNSGGPLVDTNGRAIGVVTAKMIGVGTEGIGFVIPIQAAFEALGLE